MENDNFNDVLCSALRRDCPMRHENGNCLPAGGFCTAVNKPICEALKNAYEMGSRNTMNDFCEFLNRKNWHRRDE